MPCCCTSILRLCDLILCDDQDLVLPIPIPADGEYTLQLEFLNEIMEKVATLSEGDNATFDKEDLNEQFTYTGQVKNADGVAISFTVDGKVYDCIEFTTKKKVDTDEDFVAPVSSSPSPGGGTQGPQGPAGPAGPAGADGPQGPPGVGKMVIKVDGVAGSPVAGQNTFQHADLIGKEVPDILVNKAPETEIDGDYTVNSPLGLITRVNQWFANDTAIINFTTP